MTETRPARVTLADVAAAAGVDASTVSRFVNNSASLAAATRERVRRAIEDLGYSPDRAARRLAGGRAGAIGVVVPDLTNPFFSAVARGAQREAHSHGDLTLIADADNSPAEEVALVRQLARDVDSLVLCSPTAATADLIEAAGERQVVVVNRRVRGWPSVNADQVEAVAAAHRHLLELGHRRVAYVRGPTSKWISKVRNSVAQRLGTTMVGPVDPTFAGGASASRLMTKAVTAVIAHNDQVALGLIDAVERAGRRVPDDVSVVGCDDVAVAALTRPRLTTVAMPLDDLGRTAVEVLAAGGGVFGEDASARTLDVTLVVRESTGPR